MKPILNAKTKINRLIDDPEIPVYISSKDLKNLIRWGNMNIQERFVAALLTKNKTVMTELAPKIKRNILGNLCRIYESSDIFDYEYNEWFGTTFPYSPTLVGMSNNLVLVQKYLSNLNDPRAMIIQKSRVIGSAIMHGSTDIIIMYKNHIKVDTAIDLCLKLAQVKTIKCLFENNLFTNLPDFKITMTKENMIMYEYLDHVNLLTAKQVKKIVDWCIMSGKKECAQKFIKSRY